MIAFISGHINITPHEFKKHYCSLIDDAVAKDCEFVIGNAAGVDTMALDYLIEQKVSKITLYLFPRFVADDKLQTSYSEKYPGVKLVLGFKGYTQRDAAMTKNSDFDIARVHSLEQCKLLFGEDYKHKVSGTQQNLNRRKNKSKHL